MRHLYLSVALLIAALVGLPAEVPRAIKPPAAPTVPATAPRTSVFVDHTGADVTGKAFVSGLRDGIRKSTQFRLAELEEDANLVLVVVTTSPGQRGSVASAVSLAYVVNNEWRSLLGSAARYVGRARAEEMGRATVTELSAVLAAYDPTTKP